MPLISEFVANSFNAKAQSCKVCCESLFTEPSAQNLNSAMLSLMKATSNESLLYNIIILPSLLTKTGTMSLHFNQCACFKMKMQRKIYCALSRLVKI